MNSNVHALGIAKALKPIESGKPDRADVEGAFRTIIRWAGDDPERDGLIETPARVARAFEDFCWVRPGSRTDFAKDLRRDRRL